MGFTPKRKHYRLVFADPDMQGLVVEATSPPMGVFIDGASLADLDSDDAQSAGRLKEVDALFSHFAAALMSWNLEDEEGASIPATKAGLYTQDIDFVLAVIRAWVQVTTSVAAPLSDGSSAGGPSLVASIPMETLSTSLAS